MPAAGTLIEMAAKRGGAAAFDGPQHFHMRPGNPLAAMLDESISRGADQIGHLQRRPFHLFARYRVVLLRGRR
jgi:hypothetical protein